MENLAVSSAVDLTVDLTVDLAVDLAAVSKLTADLLLYL